MRIFRYRLKQWTWRTSKYRSRKHLLMAMLLAPQKLRRLEGDEISNTYSRSNGGFDGMVTFGAGHRSYSMYQIGAMMDRSHFNLKPLRGRLVMIINIIRNGRVIVVVVFGDFFAVHESPCDGVSIYLDALGRAYNYHQYRGRVSY